MKILQRVLLLIAERFLRVCFLEYDDPKALNLIALFRGQYVTWAEHSSGVPKELDRYDTQQSTVHVAVFLRTPFKDWLIGYGRLLFGCNQMLEKYGKVLEGIDETELRKGVEVSRLLVIPNIYGHPVRGTAWSSLVQLLIYRKFFQACESREVTEWWAVLGAGLHHLLKKFGFPFEKVNDLTGRDKKGIYYAVRMRVAEAREVLDVQDRWLYQWFLKLETLPVKATRMNGRQAVPVKADYSSI